MSAVNLVLLGLCSVIVQSSVVIVARLFLDAHHERPLSAIGRSVIVTRVIFTGLSFLSTILALSALQALFALVFLAFFSPVYLSGCCQSVLTALFYTGLWCDRSRLAFSSVPGERIARPTQRVKCFWCGLGDVYLMAGLGMWFSFPAVLWVISGAAVSGGLFFAGKKITPSDAVARKRHLSFSALCAVSVWRGGDCIHWADGKLSLGGHILKKIIEKKSQKSIVGLSRWKSWGHWWLWH